MQHTQIAAFLWSVADLIRDTFKRGKYKDVILPLTVHRGFGFVVLLGLAAYGVAAVARVGPGRPATVSP